MKKINLSFVLILAVLGRFDLQAASTDWQAGMKEGKPEFKSKIGRAHV